MLLTLTARRREADSYESFYFEPEAPFTFEAGQYLRYTLPHREPDSRGVSRSFTIASAPSESYILLTTRLVKPGSTFKQALSSLEVGAVIEAAGPYRRFVYTEHEVPAVFSAGGIGITPFRSILVDLASRRLDPDITLLYANRTPDLAFQPLLDDLAAKQAHLKVVYTVSQPTPDWKGAVGRIDERFIREQVADLDRTLFCVAGPKPMVDATAKTLGGIGIRPECIKQDFFPGYDS